MDLSWFHRLRSWGRVPVSARFTVVAASCILAFEVAAFLAVRAKADDLDLLVSGSGSSGVTVSLPPPNVMVLFDDSGSMNNLLCSDLSGAKACTASGLVSTSAANGATVCASPALQALSYKSAYDSAGATLVGYQYPTFYNSYFTSSTVFSKAASQFPASVATGNSAITTACTMSDCRKRSRCIYSLRKQGYFWEPSGSTCGAGDPMSVCPATSTVANFDGPLFLGDFLNSYPPKGLSVKSAFVDAINHLTGDVRLGVRELNGGGYDIKPPCSQSTGTNCFDGDPSTVCFNPGNANMINWLNTLTYSGTTKALATALDATGQFFTTSSGQNTPICDYSIQSPCTTNNFIVLVTDGLPVNDATSASGVPFVAGKIPGISDGWASSNGYWVDEVSKALTEIDMRTDISGTQWVGTYTVSFGLTDSVDPSRCAGLLDAVATFGGGRCLTAQSVSQLSTALRTVINEIIKRVRGFTAPSLPTTRYTGTASVQSAVFRPTDTFQLWEGHLYGFRLCDEKLAADTGSSCTCEGGTTAADVCVQDANGSSVVYDQNGYLVSKPYWDAQLCLSGDAANTLGSIVQDRGNLSVASCYLSASQRVIKTATAAYDGNANTLGYSDELDFTAANVATSAAFKSALGVSDTATAQALVNFYRGFDSYDADADGNTSEDRNLDNIQDGTGTVRDGWWKLGDVFHSVPIVVEHPTGQLVRGWDGSASYRAFVTAHASRPKALLVGANDGMVHAFLVGLWDATRSRYEEDATIEPSLGKELWAFVSPEMLPKLKNVCSPGSGTCGLANHQFLVDGSVEVRDVWTGGTADKGDSSNADKWKTIAVYGHRDGGTTYVALDVTDMTTPKLLWQFPSPGTALTEPMGKSWLDTFPAPASIAPIVYSGGEKWVVLLPGGFDPLDHTGRALYVVDATDGSVLWEARHGSVTGMNYSFAATPMFYAAPGPALSIGGFIAADHGGQLWLVSTAGATIVNGKFTFTPTLFFQAGDPTKVPIAPDTDGTLVASEYQRWPFFFGPTLTRDANGVRVIIGTGDRDQLIPHANITGIGGSAGYICTDQQRLYSVRVDTCNGHPCKETDLTEVGLSSGSWADPSSRGWFLKLQGGEKVATSFNVARQYAYYSTFVPMAGCGTVSATCSTDFKGEGRLYARAYLTGKPFDFNGDGAITSADASVSLGQGVPSAATVSVGVGDGGASSAVISSSESGGLSVQQSSQSVSTETEILRVHVSPDLHRALHH